MARASSDWSFVKALLLRLVSMVGLSLVGLAVVIELVSGDWQVPRHNLDRARRMVRGEGPVEGMESAT